MPPLEGSVSNHPPPIIAREGWPFPALAAVVAATTTVLAELQER